MSWNVFMCIAHSNTVFSPYINEFISVIETVVISQKMDTLSQCKLCVWTTGLTGFIGCVCQGRDHFPIYTKDII